MKIFYKILIFLQFGLGVMCFLDAVKLWADYGEHGLSLLVLLVSYSMLYQARKNWRDFRAE